MFQKGTQLLSGSPRRPVLPSPLLALPAGSAGARGGSCPGSAAARPAAAPAPGKRGSRLPGGAGHACACGCRAEGEAGSRHLRFDLPQPFSAAGVGAGGRAGRGRVARCPPESGLEAPPCPGGRLGKMQPALGALRGGGSATSRALGAARTANGHRPGPGPRAPEELAAGPGGAPPRPPGVRALAGRRPFPLDLSLGVTKAPFYFQCHFGVCLLFPATSRFQGYGRLPAGSGRGERLQRYLI